MISTHKKMVIKLSDEDSAFPIEVLNMTDLTELEIIGGNFTYLTEFISVLVCLEKLSLASTKISLLPKEIFELPKLKYLSLKNNRISDIPLLTKSCGIQTLILNKNYLTSLDFLIPHFKELITLDVGHNLIRELPENFVELQYLTRLNLEHNRMSEIPYKLLELENLGHLNLDHNHFDQVKLDTIQQKFYK